MPENLGGAQYELTVDVSKANAKLKEFEGNVAASGRRADAAMGQSFKGGGAVPAIDKATAATKRLTTAQMAMQSAARSGATALAASVPVAGQFGAAAGGIAAAMPQVAVGVLAAASAFQLLDLGIQKYTGSGIIDHLTGEAAAHEKAAKAAADHAAMVDRIARLRREGVTPDTATLIEVENAIDSANRKWDEYNKKAHAATSIEDMAELKFPDLSTEINTIIDAKLSYADLMKFVEQAQGRIKSPEMLKELQAQAQAAEDAATSFDRWALAIQETMDKRAEFADAMSQFQSMLEIVDPQLEALRLEQAELEQLKTKMGDAFGDQNQARLREVERLIGLLEDRQDIVNQKVALFGAQMHEQYGELAPHMINNVMAALAKLPVDQQIKVSVILPDLAANIDVFRRFMAALQAGASVQVAVHFAAVNTFPGKQKTMDVLPGIGSAVTFEETSSAAQQIIDEANKAWDDFKDNSVAPLGAEMGKAAKATTEAAKDTAIWADGIVSLAEALQEGLTPARAAELEMIHDAELGVWALRDAEFRLAVEREKAERGAIGLQIALVNIAAELVRSSRTAAQFRLDEWLRPQIDNVQSMISSIFQQPTREGLQLQLQLKKLERQRLMIERRGGDTERIDKQIDALQREIDIRQTELEIMQIGLQLKDQTLQSDQDVINASIFLSGVLESLSGEAKDLVTLFGLDLFNAGMKAVGALNSVGAAGGTGVTAAEKHWINEIARQRGEPIPFPGFLQGTLGVKSTGLALVHAGEPILPPDVGNMFRRLVSLYQAEPARFDRQLPAAGAGWNVSIVIHGATNPDEVARVVEKRLRDFKRVESYGGAQATPNAWRS